MGTREVTLPRPARLRLPGLAPGPGCASGSAGKRSVAPGFEDTAVTRRESGGDLAVGVSLCSLRAPGVTVPALPVSPCLPSREPALPVSVTHSRAGGFSRLSRAGFCRDRALLCRGHSPG